MVEDQKRGRFLIRWRPIKKEGGGRNSFPLDIRIERAAVSRSVISRIRCFFFFSKSRFHARKRWRSEEVRKDRGKEDLSWARDSYFLGKERGRDVAFDVSPFFMAVDDSVEKRR